MTELIPLDQIEEAFEAKADTTIEKKESVDKVAKAEHDKCEAEIEIAKHDEMMREQGTPEKMFINGKNESERKQMSQVALKKWDDEIYKAKRDFRTAELNDNLSDLEIKKLDFKLRNMGA